MTITRGKSPSSLTGRLPVSSMESPWWDAVASELIKRTGLVGQVISIEELTAMIPDYPDGGRCRPRAAARRLSAILELVERGPNGSRGKGATYRIVLPLAKPAPAGRDDIAPDEIPIATSWLDNAIERMTTHENFTTEKKKR